MKKFIAMLLCLLLLVSAAQASALRPRRDARTEVVPGPTKPPETEIDADPAAPPVEETLPVAEAETLGSVHGRFSIARGQEARNGDF